MVGSSHPPAERPGDPTEGQGGGGLWLAWAGILMGALWWQAARRMPARYVAVALVLTGVVAGAATAAGALRGRGTVSRLWSVTGAVFAGAAVLSGELRDWLGAALVPGLAAGPGLLVVRLCVEERTPTLLTLALGLAILSHAGLVASVSGAFSPWLFVGISAAAWGLLAAIGPRRQTAPAGGSDRARYPSGRELAAAGLLWALLAILMRQASVPDCCFDPVWAHLPLAAAIAEQRAIPVPEIWWTMVPHAYHVLAAIAHALAGGMAAKLLHSVFLLLNVGWALWFGARLSGLFGGLVAASLFLTIPLVMWNGTVGDTDMGAVFFTMGAIAAFFEFRRTGGNRWLVIAGALAGTATAIKYFAAAMLVPLALILLIEGVRRQRLRRVLPGCLLLAAGLAITAGPWLARTAVLTGNPVFPVFNEYFRSPYWPTQVEDASAILTGSPWDAGQILKLPFLLTFDASRLGEVPQGALGTFPLLWLPVLLARWSAIGREGRYLLLIAAGIFVCVFSLARNPRFQLGTWLLLAIVLGGALAASDLLAGWRRGAARRLVPAILASGLAYSLLSWMTFFPAWASLDVWTGKSDARAFLRRTVPAFEVYEAVQRFVPRDAKILADGLYATWYARRYLVPSWLPPVAPLFTRTDLSRAEALTMLRERQLGYFLAPSSRRYRILELGIARRLLELEGFTLYAFADDGQEIAPPRPP
ncbi:MAG: glycosyltransferase family 39 protein [Candidatus Rokubacteria bacterium]|nr:glycosyltransferase family 39 protein [Candidatus Rokubacteria bacterium]